MIENPGAIICLLIGGSLIVFRRGFADLIIQKQLEEGTTPERVEYSLKLKEMKFKRILHKGLEIVSIVFGIVLILMSISELLPKIDKYIRYFLTYAILTFFAAAVAILAEVFLLFRFLWKNVRKYVRDRYGEGYQNVKSLCKTNMPNAVNTEMNGPVLRALQRKAAIYTVICFIPLFIIFLIAFCTLFLLTS
jgi:hypothetical protein